MRSENSTANFPKILSISAHRQLHVKRWDFLHIWALLRGPREPYFTCLKRALVSWGSTWKLTSQWSFIKIHAFLSYTLPMNLLNFQSLQLEGYNFSPISWLDIIINIYLDIKLTRKLFKTNKTTYHDNLKMIMMI